MDQTLVRRKSPMITLSAETAARSIKVFHSSMAGVRPALVFMHSVRTLTLPSPGPRTKWYALISAISWILGSNTSGMCAYARAARSHLMPPCPCNPLKPVPSASHFRLRIRPNAASSVYTRLSFHVILVAPSLLLSPSLWMLHITHPKGSSAYHACITA